MNAVVNTSSNYTFFNGSTTNDCNTMFNFKTCFNCGNTTLKVRKETYLERSMGYLIIGIVGILANSFTILILGSSSKIRQKVVNTLIIHQSFVDFLASIALVGTAHIDVTDKHGLCGLAGNFIAYLLVLNGHFGQ